MKGREDIEIFQNFEIETIVTRWVNYHLIKAGQKQRISNIGHDLADSYALMFVLSSLDNVLCPADKIGSMGEEEVVTNLDQALAKMGVPKIMEASLLENANKRANTLLVSCIMLTKHGLEADAPAE